MCIGNNHVRDIRKHTEENQVIAESASGGDWVTVIKEIQKYIL